MNSKTIQKILKGIVIFIFGLFDVILLIRLILRLIGASETSTFVQFWYSLSNPLFGPFYGTMNDFSSNKLVLEINAMIAIIIYFVLAIFGLKVISGVFKPKVQDKIRDLLDTVFKVLEVLLGLRGVFKMLGAGLSGFITFLYGISWPFYAPFQGILKDIQQGNVIIELSTIVAVIIIIILDFASDRLLNEIFKDEDGDGNEPKPTAAPAAPDSQPQAAAPANQSLPAAPAQVTVQPQAPAQQPTVNVNVAQPQPLPPAQPVQDQPMQPTQMPGVEQQPSQPVPKSGNMQQPENGNQNQDSGSQPYFPN